MSEPKKVNLKRVPTKEQDPHARAGNFNEVNYGYDAAEAKDEAGRCLFCKKPQCVIGCPVMINIPGFVNAISKGDYFEAYHILMDSNVMPAVCGRVCPQETQCEERCILGKKGDAVSVGKLERFVGDWAIKQGLVKDVKPVQKGSKKVAIVGSGPSAIACAHDLARAGVDVTVYEALHTAGGVLKYGIPNFRLPNEVVDIELEKLNKLGVKFELNKVIGRIFTIPDLLGKMGFNAVFIGTGAGTPKFMGIPGEGLNGMLSSNEFLTRVNLMEAYKFPNVDTPVVVGKKVAVVGAGNTAMDSVRTAKRLGSEHAMIVYRRTEKEAPARIEELHHAMEEGIEFYWLTAPVKINGDENGWIKSMECIKMELGPPDESGRRRPVEIKGSNFTMDVDMVICALGTSSNPIVAQTTPGLKVNKWGYIETSEENQMTSIPGVFAGGDIVTGAATVISAMGAGRKAAAGILKFLGI
ncbi:MAG: NADPH-dependent glutamate synthase [Deltaproteobacteria bacterium]|nr:NADPH-dependent glutamate synthase [Deltaproteobacteria bacterium]